MGGVSLWVLFLHHRFDEEALATQGIPSIYPFKGHSQKTAHLMGATVTAAGTRLRDFCKPVQGPLSTRTHVHGSHFLSRTPKSSFCPGGMKGLKYPQGSDTEPSMTVMLKGARRGKERVLLPSHKPSQEIKVAGGWVRPLPSS